jgi:hypothetical protein
MGSKTIPIPSSAACVRTSPESDLNEPLRLKWSCFLGQFCGSAKM